MTCGSGTSPSRQIGVRRSDRSSCGSKQNVMRCHALFLPEGEPRMSNSLSRKSLSLSSLQSSPCGLYLRRRKAGQARVHELDIKRGLALREREDASGGEAAQEHCRNPRNICPSVDHSTAAGFCHFPSLAFFCRRRRCATVLSSSSSHLYHATPASFSTLR